MRCKSHIRQTRAYSERTKLVILWIYIAIVRCSISRRCGARFAIDNDTISADNLLAYTCTGGTRPLVARARAPVCPSLATPLQPLSVCLKYENHCYEQSCTTILAEYIFLGQDIVTHCTKHIFFALSSIVPSSPVVVTIATVRIQLL